MKRLRAALVLLLTALTSSCGAGDESESSYIGAGNHSDACQPACPDASANCCTPQCPDSRGGDSDAVVTRPVTPDDLPDGRSSCEQRYTDLGLEWPLPATATAGCGEGGCVSVPVTVNYMLINDLGDDMWLVVEAFDNPLFAGAPVRVVAEPGFDATKTGNKKSVLLTVPAGEYYLRAYLKDDETPMPYPYMNMILVSENPVGIYGALSDPSRLIAEPYSADPCPLPEEIFLDKLFKDPTKEPPTNAKLRLKFVAEETVDIPDHRKLLIQLHSGGDFNANPVAQYELATENLLISSRKGKAEFVTPNLDEGAYFLFAFIDTNENGFYDEGEEVAATHQADGSPIPVLAKKNYTQTIRMSLEL